VQRAPQAQLERKAPLGRRVKWDHKDRKVPPVRPERKDHRD
jgi:hypothetical protein